MRVLPPFGLATRTRLVPGPEQQRQEITRPRNFRVSLNSTVPLTPRVLAIRLPHGTKRALRRRGIKLKKSLHKLTSPIRPSSTRCHQLDTMKD